MRLSAVIIMAALLGGCATVTTEVALFPDENGSAGSLVVLDGAGDDTSISQPNTIARLGKGPLRARPVPQVYQDLLGALPSPPVRFVFYFVAGTTRLTPESTPALEGLRSSITATSDVEIVGHTDTVGSTEDNDFLSLQRAREVRAYLLSAGLPVESAESVGRGERELLVMTPDDTDEPRNRRIEVIVR